MEIGTEISQKIRSAIKAKLIEQGAYVDDELPDYIMVMVANKKSQKQMTDDLSLFLGSNTEKFTSWLHGLLKKLQSINTEPSSSKHKTKEKHKGEKKKRKTSHGEKEKPVTKEPETVRRTSITEKEKRKSVEEKGESVAAKPKQATPVIESEQSAEISILENTDEFAEETKEIAKKEQAKAASTGKPPPSKVSKTEKSVDVKKGTTKAVHKEPKDSSHSAKPKSASSSGKPKVTDESRESKKKPTSFVASVKRKYEVEEEEEYDPLNPAVGSVASVIHGPTRKSSVPKSLQANKSLLMKAVTEAEKSVHIKKKPEHVTASADSSKAGMRSDRRPVDLKHRLKTAAGLQLMSRSKRKDLEVMRYSVDNESGGEPSRKPQQKSSETFENMKYTVRNEAGPGKPVSPRKTKFSVVSAPSRVAATALRRLGQAPKTVVKTEEVEEAPSDDDDELSLNEELEEEYGPPLPDMRLVQRTHPGDDDDNNEEDGKSSTQESVGPSPDTVEEETDQGMPGTPSKQQQGRKKRKKTYRDPEIQRLLEDAEDTMVDFNDDLRYEEYKRKIKSRPPLARRSPTEPRFIVTLDGVDPNSYEVLSMGRSNPVQTVKPIPKKPVPVQAPKSVDQSPDLAPVKQIGPPLIKPFNINLKDTDDEDDGEGEAMDIADTQSSKIGERCRFWPACANGNDCQYIHPSVPCKTFPYCKFGDKCVYIHPNCRFDAHCTRMDCPYTHSSKRAAFGPTVIHKIMQVPMQPYFPPNLGALPAAPRPQQTTQCRFFPNCRNMTCPFSHPKPCRYGIGCMSKSSCTFYHPPVPGKDKLKWSSSTKKSPGDIPGKSGDSPPEKLSLLKKAAE